MENIKGTDLNSWPDSMISREQERLDKHMIAAFRHAANSLAVTSGVIKSHISQDEAAQSVAGDQYFLELISEAELRIGMQQISFECQTTLLNSCEKALADRDAQIERLREAVTDLSTDVDRITMDITGDPTSECQDESDILLSEITRIRQEALSNG
jgi:hypothetical protein